MAFAFQVLNFSTVFSTGGWGEKGLNTGNHQNSEPAPKNAPSSCRAGHALLNRLISSNYSNDEAKDVPQ